MSNAQQTQIILKNHRISMFIGIDEHEKLVPQPVIISVWLDIKFEISHFKNDDISEVYNYVDLKQEIEKISAQGHINLLETFAEKIVNCALEHPMVQKCRVYVEKPQVFDNVESIGFEMTRERSA